MTTKPLLLAALVGVAFAGVSDIGGLRQASADGRRTNDLEDQPAVRHRRLLVKNRFEFAPLFESTINAPFQHIVGGGLKLEYHLSDVLSVGVVGVYSTALHTKLIDRIVPTLEGTTNNATREPSVDEYQDHLNSMPIHGGGFVSVTPWYGKLAAFGAAFVAFDFYFQGGVSFAQLKSDCPTSVCTDKFPGISHMEGMDTIPADNNPNNDMPLNSGGRVGLYLAGGLHVFLSDFLALDLTVRDYAFSDNPSGADYNADLFVGTNSATGSDDNRFLHHLFFGAGVSIMLPASVKRTP